MLRVLPSSRCRCRVTPVLDVVTLMCSTLARPSSARCLPPSRHKIASGTRERNQSAEIAKTLNL
jgi:hypothetical protein